MSFNFNFGMPNYNFSLEDYGFDQGLASLSQDAETKRQAAEEARNSASTQYEADVAEFKDSQANDAANLVSQYEQEPGLGTLGQWGDLSGGSRRGPEGVWGDTNAWTSPAATASAPVASSTAADRTTAAQNQYNEGLGAYATAHDIFRDDNDPNQVYADALGVSLEAYNRYLADISAQGAGTYSSGDYDWQSGDYVSTYVNPITGETVNAGEFAGPAVTYDPATGISDATGEQGKFIDYGAEPGSGVGFGTDASKGAGAADTSAYNVYTDALGVSRENAADLAARSEELIALQNYYADNPVTGSGTGNPIVDKVEDIVGYVPPPPPPPPPPYVPPPPPMGTGPTATPMNRLIAMQTGMFGGQPQGQYRPYEEPSSPPLSGFPPGQQPIAHGPGFLPGEQPVLHGNQGGAVQQPTRDLKKLFSNPLDRGLAKLPINGQNDTLTQAFQAPFRPRR